MSFNKQDTTRDEFMLKGPLAKNGYDWWWHSFTALDRLTKEEKQFYVEFFLVNPKLASLEPVLGQAKENKEHKIKPSYLMVNVGTWGKDKVQLHRFFSLKDVEIHSDNQYIIEADDCYASESRLSGKVSVTKEEALAHPEMMSDAGEIIFDLRIFKEIAFNVGYGANKFFRDLNAFEMYWHAEGMKSSFEGVVNYNGRIYDVIKDKSYGYSDKNWGSNFTSPWVWLSSNKMTSNLTKKELTNSVFDIGGGCPKVFHIPLKRKLLSAFYYEGKEFEFNFSKFWTNTKTTFDCKETDKEIIWHVIQTSIDGKMDATITSKKEDMLLINYEDPSGNKRHNRLWNGGNGMGRILLYTKKKGQYILLDDIDVKNVGCEYGEYDK